MAVLPWVFFSLGLASLRTGLAGGVVNAPAHRFLITPSELHKQTDSWAILDARGQDGAAAGAIHGASFMSWPELAIGVPLANKSVLLAPSELIAKLVAVGIDGRRPVVVYGSWQGGWGEEGRMFWILDYLGFAASGLRCLEGGIDAWIAAGYPASPPQGVASQGGAPSNAASQIDADRRATTSFVDQVVDHSTTQVVLLDVREESEYLGVGKTTYGAPRSGHIPGAVWWNWQINIFAGASLRTCSEILSSLPVEVTSADVVITYCTGGIRSAFAYMALRGCGIGGEHLRNYDGSWWAWSSNSSLPCVGQGGSCKGSTGSSFGTRQAHLQSMLLPFVFLFQALCRT